MNATENKLSALTAREIADLPSTHSSVKHFHYMGWTWASHGAHVIKPGMESHLLDWHKAVPANDDAIRDAILLVDPALA